MVEGVNGYGILTDNGTCLNHLKYPVTHNLISYRDYHQSLLLHMHSPLGGIMHAFLCINRIEFILESSPVFQYAAARAAGQAGGGPWPRGLL